ncbi:MAG TPA: hypothetical protein VMU48_21060 [Terracidiphilus sp.]|nr:hypothetical protein [Terracidiphilus sp.]
MNRMMRQLMVAIFASVFWLSIPVFAQQSKEASATMDSKQDHFHPGSDLSFKMTLNEPLPEGARFDVRLSPIKTDQEIPVSSGEPTNKERTEFTLHTKLPERAVPGEWHIKIAWLFLAGASWTNNTLSTNDMRFVVEGPEVKIPTAATATIIKP